VLRISSQDRSAAVDCAHNYGSRVPRSLVVALYGCHGGIAREVDMRLLKSSRIWRAPVLLLGLLCLMAPPGLAAPALFTFLLFVLVVLGEPA
jgi:hypothetical protein